MSAIITGVFKVTIGLAATKARNVLAERLKEGDVADQKFRDLIVSDIKDIKSKLDALSQKDLGAAVDFFETGLRYLNDANSYGRHSDNATRRAAQVSERNKEKRFEELTLPSATSAENTVVLTEGIKTVQLNEMVDEEARRALSHAKDRFRMAREKATDASNNEALSTFDRITAIRYRAMAAMLESAADMAVGTAGDVKITLKRALPECEQCLQKLHSLPAVQKSFKVEFEKDRQNVRSYFRGRISKDERREIISIVCQINRVVYDTIQAVGRDVHVWVWPYVDTGEDKVDPLRDRRISKVLHKVKMGHCCVTPWSFGQESEEEHKVKGPRGIATNTKGQFLIADDGDKTVKVFDSNGKFEFRFNPQTDGTDTKLHVLDVATTDVDDRIYILVGLKKPGAENKREVQVFTKTGNLQHKFPVRERERAPKLKRDLSRLTVSSSKLLLLTCKYNIFTSDGYFVDVHELSGEFVGSLNEGEFKRGTDITASCDGCVLILDQHNSVVYLFDVEGHQLAKFNVTYERDGYSRIACHPTSEHVVVAGCELGTGRLTLAIYTVNGEFIRRIQLDEEIQKQPWYTDVYGIRVTVEGHIAVAFRDKDNNEKVIGV